MSPAVWQSLLKVRKVFTQKGAPVGVREILRDAIDSAARQVDAAAQRKTTTARKAKG